LEDPTVRILERRDGDHVLAGAIASRSGRVVGVSNVFTLAEPPDEVWSQLSDLVSRCFPGLPLVGYEQGADLAAARSAGFSVIGPLRVWVRDATS